MAARRAWLLAVLTVLLSAASVPAASITWANASGGNFQTPGNWNPAVVPGPADVAVFNIASPAYTVTWSAPVTNLVFNVNAGTVTWNLGGYTYSYFYTNVACTIGTATNAVNLTITNGTITYATYNYKPASISGTGTMVRVNQASVTLLYAGIGAGATVIADGTNTVFGSYGYTTGLANLIVTNNARLSASSGTDMYSGNRLDISGTGSGSHHSCAFSKFQSNSTVRVANGAIVDNSYVSYLVPMGGRLTLDGAQLKDAYTTTTMTVTGAVAILEGKGELDFRLIANFGGQIWPGGSNSAGQLLVKGDVSNAVPGSGTIAIELGGTLTNQYDRLSITNGTGGSGTLYAGGTLKVSLINGFQLTNKATFKILDFVSATGVFDAVILPGDASRWNTQNLYTTGQIQYGVAQGTVSIFR